LNPATGLPVVATYPNHTAPAPDPDWAKPIRHDVFFTQYRYGEILKKLADGDTKGAASDLEYLANACAKIEAACRRAADDIKNDPAGWRPVQ